MEISFVLCKCVKMKLDTHMIIFVMTIKKRYELDGVFVVCVDV